MGAWGLKVHRQLCPQPGAGPQSLCVPFAAPPGPWAGSPLDPTLAEVADLPPLTRPSHSGGPSADPKACTTTTCSKPQSAGLPAPHPTLTASDPTHSPCCPWGPAPRSPLALASASRTLRAEGPLTLGQPPVSLISDKRLGLGPTLGAACSASPCPGPLGAVQPHSPALGGLSTWRPGPPHRQVARLWPGPRGQKHGPCFFLPLCFLS